MKPMAPWLLGAAGVLLSAAAPQPAFVPPNGPLVLTRTVVRPLSDGKEIVVRRRYEVRFTRLGRGFQVDGHLLDCTVDAPPSLRALAEIERKRPDTGLFPMALDERGQILSQAKAGPSAALDDAARLAADKLADWPLAPMAEAQARAFVQQLQARGSGSAWPTDVFQPAPGHLVDRRAIPLADGSSGSVTVAVTAAGREPGGPLSSIVRSVTTQLGAERRTSREEYRLAAPD